MKSNYIFSKWKCILCLTILGVFPLNIITKNPVKSNPISEKIAFCEEYASSSVPFNDTNFLENYKVVYNFCMKELEKQRIRLSYEKERGKLSSSTREKMKNKLLTIDSEMNSKCSEKRKEISPGFFICDLVLGEGRATSESDYIFVEYIGEILNGKEFDSSYARESFFAFTLGEGKVIKGWEQGLKNMKEGGIRKIVIPPELAYGSQKKNEMIPPNSTLVFLIHLLKVY